MKGESNVELTLKQLIVRAGNMRPQENIDIYLDPLTRFWYILPSMEIKYWIPSGATFIGKGEAKDLLYIIETFMSHAVRQLIREEKV